MIKGNFDINYTETGIVVKFYDNRALTAFEESTGITLTSFQREMIIAPPTRVARPRVFQPDMGYRHDY